MRPRLPVLAATAALVVIAAVVLNRPGDDSLDRLRAAGSIRIGYSVEAPFAFVTPQGQVTGEAPETARIMATRLGLGRVIWRQAAFELLRSELLAGRIDVIAAGMFITPERERHMRFSRPTVLVTPGLLVPAGNPRGLHGHRDLMSPDLRVAVLPGSAEEDVLLAHGLPSSRLVRVPDAGTGRAAVLSGEADALALSTPTLRWMLHADPQDGLEIAEAAEAGTEAANTPLGRAAFAFRHEDRALAGAWDRELAAWLGSAEHRALLARFGFEAAPTP